MFASPFDFSQWTLANYERGRSPTGNMGRAFVNSIAITLPATIIPIMIAAFAAYAFTFMRFPGRDVLFILVVSLLVVPNQVALVPLLQIYGDFGLNGTFPAAWLAHIGFGMPLAIYILRTYMATLPKELIESAKIDGASHFTTFWRLIVPVSVPALASFAIFQFLWVWNDLLVALLFIGPGENEPMTVNLAGLVGPAGPGLAADHRRRLLHHDRPADRLPLAAAVLRPRHDRRGRQGLSPAGVAWTSSRRVRSVRTGPDAGSCGGSVGSRIGWPAGRAARSGGGWR